MTPQKYPKDKREKELIILKIKPPIDRRYTTDGLVRSLSGFFSVPKGDNDIRRVYDMTKCGLNACLLSPRFFLPSPDSLFDAIEYNSWMSGTDQGEMFLNYFADPTLLPCLGVDATEVFKHLERREGKGRIWIRWCRWPMGVRQSPYATT